MGSSRRKGSARAAAAAAAARQQWKIGDLVLAKMKGFPAWPAMISEPEKWGFSSDRKKLLVYFYGTKQIAFCNYADIEAFTEEKKKSLLLKRQGKGADFVRAVEEIIDVFETLKEKNLAVDDSADENNDGTVSNKENLKDSTVSCFGKTEEAILNSSDNHQSQCASATESCNMVNEDVNPGTLPDSGNHNKSILENGLGEKVSILDQLRQIPLSSISTTRKRARDAIFLSSCRKSCVSSHRRSRSSSGYKLDKPENSSVQAEFEPDAGLQGADIFQQYHSTKEHAFIGSIVSASTETSSISTGVPTNGIHVENLAFKSESINLGDGNVFSYNDNIESSNNSACLNVLPKGDGSINATVDITLKAVAVKRQRKPRKPGAICSEVDKEMESQIENGSLSDSSNSRDGTTEKFSKADGDKHLPLVKRARVRMGKPPEEKMDDSILLRSKVDDNVISATPVPNPLNESLERDSPVFKEAVGSKSNDCTRNNTGRDSLSSKTNKYQLPLVVEAALPPSKRLHRALEAMSANAADDVTDRSQAQRAMETKFDDIMGCLKANFDHVDHSESVKCSTKPLPLQSSNDSTFHGSACGFSSSITAQNQVVYGSPSSKLESDDTRLTKNMMDPIEKYCKKNLVGSGSFDDSITSKMTCTPSQTCSLDFEEKRCGECVYNHVASPAVEENGWKQLSEESTYPRVDGGSLLVASGTCNARHVCLPSIGVAVPQSSDAACSASEMDGDVAVPLAGNVDSFASHQNGVISVSSGSLGSNMPRPVAASSTATACVTSDILRATVSSRREFEESLESRDMQNSSTEVKEHLTLKARSVASTVAPIKDLIAAAQAKRFLSRSTSFCDNVIDGKVAPDAVVSPSLISKEDSSGHISPSNPMLNRRPSSDDGTCYLQNGNRTPLGFSFVKGSKYMNHAEANAARRSFESLLCTLSRTKESIGRATRLAIDCAKCGIAGEVIDMLLHNLEKEPRLHRRIDLFFLVDSITQFSRCQRGGPGDVYPSLVQVVLPRLLSAAAPPGNGASENRRQCLKVLRLWLERRTLPEFIVRHHIRELEYGGEASLINSYSRRPPRTERALNDPVREMEGMLVDEYGSNASFQLPQLFNTRVMEDDAGSASEEKGFESVTPDRSAEVDNEKAITPKSSEKHRLVLEDVDGELEMEDVAPPCGHYVVSTCFVGGVNGVKISNHICKNNAFPFAPPLPEDRPPSPPPLPSSPDPISQAFSISSMDQHRHPSCDKADFYSSRAIQPAENQLPQTPSQLPNMLRVSSSLTESGPPYYGQGYVGHPQQMPALVSSGASSGLYDNLSGSQLAMPPANISQPIVNAPLASKVYALQPPVPVVSNQFSYLQAQPPKRQEAWGNHSSCTDRFDHAFYNQRDKFYRDGVPTGPIPPDSNRAELYPSNHSGHRVLEPDKMEAPPVPPFHGHQLEASSASCQVWSNRPRQFAYPGTAPRPSLENPDFRLTGAPTYWRAR